MVNTEQLKSNIKITHLAETLGIELRGNKANCLWHNEKTPSLSFDNEKGIYKCFGCGESGDIFTLYQKVKNVDFKEALEALGGVEIKQEPMVEQKYKSDSELYEGLIEHLYAQGRGEAVDSFLKDRGFTEETLSRYMIAGIKDLADTKKFLEETYGKTRLVNAGLFGKGGFVFSNHSVILPVVSGGRIVAVRGRNLTGNAPKYLQAVGIPLPIWNADELSDTVYLTEGEFDAMALSQLGVVAYGICGTNGFKDEFKKHFENKDVILAFDNDDAGKKATKEVAEKLKETANTISTVEIPEGMKDMNECMRAGVNPISFPRTVLKDGLRILHISEIAEQQRKDQSLEKIPTGFQMLDDVFQGGLRAGNSVIVAAIAGDGKTAFMQTVSSHYSRRGITSLWLSYEETISEIWSRFQAMGSDNTSLLFAPFDNESNKIDFIEKAIIRQKMKTPFFVLFLDQLSNLAPKMDKDVNINQISNNISLYLGLMSKQIKELAMKHKIIIFTAHQLGRTGELAYSDMVRHAPDKVLYIERELAPPGGTEKYTDKTYLKVNKNRPYGTRPIIPMWIQDERFVPYGMTEQVAYAERVLNPLV